MELREEIITLGEKATGVIGEYFENVEKDGKRVDRAIRILNNSTKILQMNQVRDLREKSHILQLLKFLPDEKVKRQYISITNPQIGKLLLEGRPKPKKKG